MRVYDGYLKIDKVEIPLKKGGTAMREALKSRDAVAVLCKVYGKDEYLFVEQNRAPVGGRIIEVPAGCLEEGENPIDCAKREVKEETGRFVLAISSKGSFYPSPGYSSEKIHLFFAVVDANPSEQHLDGDEEVEIVSMSKKDIFDNKDVLNDMKTQLLIMKEFGVLE